MVKAKEVKIPKEMFWYCPESHNGDVQYGIVLWDERCDAKRSRICDGGCKARKVKLVGVTE